MRKQRRGYSLVECLVAISLMSTTLGVVAITLHSLRRQDASLRQDLEQAREFHRFVQRWRDDVHGARAASNGDGRQAENSNAVLRLTMNSTETIEYTFEQEQVLRTHRVGNKIRHRDSFGLPDAASCRWIIERDRAIPRVRLNRQRDNANSEFQVALSAALLGSDE
jgi:prepilin-type N-terminal cleavage/methylation domain-containing protein